MFILWGRWLENWRIVGYLAEVARSRYEFEAKESVTRRRHGLNGRAARAEGQRSFESRRLAALNKELYSHIYSCRKTLRRLLTFVQRTVCALSPFSLCASFPILLSLFLSRYSPPPFLPLHRTRRCIFTSSLSFLPSFLSAFSSKPSLSLSLLFSSAFRSLHHPRLFNLVFPTPVRHFGTNLRPSLENRFLDRIPMVVWNYYVALRFFSREKLPPLLPPLRQCRDKRWTTIFWR